MRLLRLIWRYLWKVVDFKKGVAHVTLDPEGPGSVRLHLVPPSPNFWEEVPSLLVINGYFSIPVGPAWAMVLRFFFEELVRSCPVNKEVKPEELKVIENRVARKVRWFYRVEKTKIITDLHAIVTLAFNIPQGIDLPEELGKGDSYERYLKNASGPQRMDLIVSPMKERGKRLCQLNCGCCYAECHDSMMSVDRQLSTDEWRSIIDKCRTAGIPALTFTGGEPLVRSDIVDLVHHAKWFVTRINTNGYALTKELAQELRDVSLDGIQITLYSSDPQIHDELVGKDGAWDRTVEGIRNAIEAGLMVSVNTPLIKSNQNYTETLNFLAGLGIHYVTCSGLIPTGKATTKIANKEDLTRESLVAILKEAVAACDQFGMDINFTSPGQLDENTLREIGFPVSPVCGAAFYNMAISPTGEVIPCQSWLDGQKFGNMLNDSWASIWKHSNRERIARTNAGKNSCPLKGVEG